MREMKDSGIEWIGEIPRQWKIIKLCYITSMIFLGKTPIYSTEKNENLTLGQKNNQLYGLDLEGIKYSTNEHFLSCKESEYLQFGDILLNSLGTGSVGRIGYFNVSDKKMITDGHIIVIRPNDKVNNKYLFYYLTTLRKKMEDDAVGSTNQAFLTVPKIYKIEIPFPSLSEQQAIADFLDTQCAEIDSVIEQTKATIEEYKKFKQSIITEAVTKGIRGDRPMKDSGIEWIDSIPVEWDISRTKVLFTFGKGLPITKENLIETGVPVISYGQIHSKTNSGTALNDDLYRFVYEEYLETNASSLVHAHDFIVADTSEDADGCGNCVFVDSEMVLFAGYHTIILHSNTGDDNKYLAYLFKTDAWRSQIRSKVSGVKLFSISKKILSDTTLLLPSDEERAEIVAYLDAKCAEIDILIEKKTKLLEEMEALKKSTIFECVTGKKKVLN